MIRALLLLLVALLLQACVPPESPSASRGYTTVMYRRALANGSTSPDLVLISVGDVKRGTTRLVCTEAPFLEGALHAEHDISYEASGIARVRELALGQTDRTFRFSKPKAIANVTPRYTPQILDAVRATIKSRSDDELLGTDFVETLYANKLGGQYAAYRNAVAHALLERGISCRRGCIVGDLIPYR